MIRRIIFQQSVAANGQAIASSAAVAEDAVVYQSVDTKVSSTGTSSSSVSTVTARSSTNLTTSDNEKEKSE